MPVDFGLTASDYAGFRAGFPDSMFERLQSYRLGLPGQKVVDLGTGTGALGRGFARRGCHVIGIDLSYDLMNQARQLDRLNNVSSWHLQGRAEQVGLASAWADLVSAGQCWHWFERSQSAAEAWRLLRQGGCILVAHLDWIPSPGNLLEMTEELILKHNPDWVNNPAWVLGGRAGIYPAWLADLSGAGFHDLETFSYDWDIPYTPEAWRGRIRASAGVGASLSPEAVRCFDSEMEELLYRNFAAELLLVPHRVWGLVGVKG